MKHWTLIWSCSSKPIGTVCAETDQEAVRMAPQPYVEFLGEVYAEEVPKLLDIDGFIHINPDCILLKVHPEGDCDTIHATHPNLDNLAGALYDAREVGDLPPNCREVLLPDGKLFPF